MDSRPHWALAALGLALILAACSKGSEHSTAPSAAAGSEAQSATASAPSSAPSANETESAGLVGTEVVAEAIEVVDEGPAAPLVLFTAGLKGYTEPCGCTLDLILGGIDRVVGVAAALDEQAPATLALDAGNLLFEHAQVAEHHVEQETRRLLVLQDALRALGTRATTPGPTDLALGADLYVRTLAAVNIDVLSANLTVAGAPIGIPATTYALGDEEVGVIGVASSSAFAGIEGAATTPALEAIDGARADIEGASVVIVLFQGDLQAARTELAGLRGVDFIILGDPRETDEVETIGSARTLEAYDQGRYLGRLKLLRVADAEDAGAWENARAVSAEELARIDRVIERTQSQLETLPAADASGAVPPIVQSLRDRVEGLQAERASLVEAGTNWEAGARVFHYEPLALVPGFPVEASITTSMREYNRALREIAARNAPPRVPVQDGHPRYVGDALCANCHPREHEFWLTTSHGHAIETLVTREKDFDHSCVGCHVTGYYEPGGSALTDREGLENVQCESCHGPGEFHAQNPSAWVNVPLGVQTEVPESGCVGCHNEEHSTTFAYDRYVAEVLGPGHGHD